MPKISKTTASSQYDFPGYMESFESSAGPWNVTFESYGVDADLSPLFKGATGDLCQATHLGYVITGRFGVRNANGSEEIFEAGDAFVIEPGHIPLVFAGGEYVAFTTVEDTKWQESVMMPNLPEFANSLGIELPEEIKRMMSPS